MKTAARLVLGAIAFLFAGAVYAQIGLPWPGPGGAGAQFFVANGGSDSNPGTLASPWQTITKVNSSAPAGSKVFFNGGQTFTTTTGITTLVSISSYGTGNATISSGNSASCVAQVNPSGLSYTHLICAGGGVTTNTTDGFLLQNNTSAQLTGPTISDLTISGYGANCLRLNATGNFGFTGGTIGTGGVTGSAPTGAAGGGLTLHDCTGKSGVFTNAIAFDAGPAFTASPSAFTGITIDNLIAFNLNGYAGAGSNNWTGSGFWIEASSNVTLQHFLIHDTGLNSNTTSGPACGSMNGSSNITIQYFEVYNCFTGNSIDGDGIDFDLGTSNSTIQYGYIHDCTNYGAYEFANGATDNHTGNVMRWLVISNCGTGMAHQAVNGASIAGAVATNNVIFGANTYNTIGNVSGHVSNNMLYCLTPTFTGVSVNATSNTGTLTLTGNGYYGDCGITWGGSTYANVALWQAATGQEKIGGVSVAVTTEPRLVVYGYHGATSGYVPASLTQYQTQIGSPLLGGGIDITAQYGIGVGSTDFYGVAITSSTKLIGAGQQVAWSGASSATCSQATAFIGRLTSPPTSEQQAANALLCGGVVDGTLSLMDGLWKLAADTTTNAALNMISTSFGLIPSGSCTFTANHGYTGDGLTCFINTGFTPSTAGGHYVLNSAHNSVYVTAAGTRPNAGGTFDLGAIDGSGNGVVIAPVSAFSNPANSTLLSINENWTIGGGLEYNVAQVTGGWVSSRTGSGAEAGYLNSGAVGTPVTSVTSTALPAFPIHLLASSANTGDFAFSTDQIAYASTGAGLTAAQAFWLTWRINADATALGINQF